MAKRNGMSKAIACQKEEQQQYYASKAKSKGSLKETACQQG